VQGYTEAYKSGPFMPMRQFYQWQAFEADFERNEFTIGVVGDNVDELIQRQPALGGAVIGAMCTSFSRITPMVGGAKVMQ